MPAYRPHRRDPVTQVRDWRSVALFDIFIFSWFVHLLVNDIRVKKSTR